MYIIKHYSSHLGMTDSVYQYLVSFSKLSAQTRVVCLRRRSEVNYLRYSRNDDYWSVGFRRATFWDAGEQNGRKMVYGHSVQFNFCTGNRFIIFPFWESFYEIKVCGEIFLLSVQLVTAFCSRLSICSAHSSLYPLPSRVSFLVSLVGHQKVRTWMYLPFFYIGALRVARKVAYDMTSKEKL